MSWNPTKQVIDLTDVIDNILGYISDNQADAHKWANGGVAMDAYTLYPSATGRTMTKFPQLAVIEHGHEGEQAQTANGDCLVITLKILFQGALSGPNHEELVVQVRKYVHALESMLVNIPVASISTDLSNGGLNGYRSTFDEIGRGGLSASSWLQEFNTLCEFELMTAAY